MIDNFKKQQEYYNLTSGCWPFVTTPACYLFKHEVWNCLTKNYEPRHHHELKYHKYVKKTQNGLMLASHLL